MAEYLGEYVPFCDGMQFAVGLSVDDTAGRGLFATDTLPPSADLLEEVPLIAWPAQKVDASSDETATFCDACLCVFPKARGVKCLDSACSACFCSTACASSDNHIPLCGTLPGLRMWRAGECHHGESLARCNLQIAKAVACFVTQHGLDPAVALLNALRPYERLCTWPSNGMEPQPWHRRLCLTTAAAEALADALRAKTLRGLTMLLEASMPSAAAREIAMELTSPPHVTGLLVRIQLNTIYWTHPTHAALRFGGVFLLASNLNHSCAPNAEVQPIWTPSAGEEASTGAMETFSLALRSIGSVACGEELRRSYVAVEGVALGVRRAQLSHWGIDCNCKRCLGEVNAMLGQASEKEEQVETAAEEEQVETEQVETAAEEEAVETEQVETAAEEEAVVTAKVQPSATRSGQKRKTAPSLQSQPRPPPSQEPTPPSKEVPVLVTRERPSQEEEDSAAIMQHLHLAASRRVGDWRYSLLPGAVPREAVVEVSRAFFEVSGLLTRPGNTFGKEFEAHYIGHKSTPHATTAHVERQREPLAATAPPSLHSQCPFILPSHTKPLSLSAPRLLSALVPLLWQITFTT